MKTSKTVYYFKGNQTMRILIAGTFMTLMSFAVIANGATPGTANSFREINPYKTPIVTNAEEAVWAALKPTPVVVKREETDDWIVGSMVCSPQRMNVITNDWSDLMDFDEGIYCDSMGDYRTWEIYFGPEYRPLILVPPEHCITLRFLDGVVANGSTNDILITKVPVIIKSKQLLDKQIWVTLEYPEFHYEKIVPTSVTKVGSVVTIYGTNLVKVTNVKNDPNKRIVGLLNTDLVSTNFYEFAMMTNYSDWSYSNTTNYNFTFKELEEGADKSWCYQIPGDDSSVWYSSGNTNENDLIVYLTISNNHVTASRTSSISLVNETLGSELEEMGRSLFTFTLTTESSEYLTEYETKTIDLTVSSTRSNIVIRDEVKKEDDEIVEEKATTDENTTPEDLVEETTEEVVEEPSILQKVMGVFSW